MLSLGLCACCSGEIHTKTLQKKLHIIRCQGCPRNPFVCSECRWKKGRTNPIVTCKWCKTSGTLHSMCSTLAVHLNMHAAIDWHKLRMETEGLKFSCYSAKLILTNWKRYLQSKDMVNRLHDTCSDFVISLRTGFFHTWLNFQLLQKIDIKNFSAFYSKTKMSKSFSDILKTISFARMLVSNLFGKPSESIISLRMSRFVFKHLLSNFAVLFKLLLSKLFILLL
jgi:hypothetical protein